MAVAVGDAGTVLVAVAVLVDVLVGVADAVTEGDAVAALVPVGEAVAVDVLVRVAVEVAVAVDVLVGVLVRIAVAVAVAVLVGVLVAVARVMTSCGALAPDSRLASASAVELLVASAKLKVPLPVMYAVTLIEFHVFATAAPDEPSVAPSAGALLNVMVVSPQVLSDTARTE